MWAKKRLTILLSILMVLLPVSVILPGTTVTAATLGPKVISLSPANNAMNVPLRTELKITFDENIVKQDNSKKIAIYNYANNTQVDSYTMNSSAVSISNNVLTVQVPNNKLSLNTEYYVLVDAGAVANVSNGALFSGISNPSEWNFKTITVTDNVKPTLTNHYGLCASTGTCNVTLPITTSLTFTFDEPVYVGSGSFSLSSNIDNRTIAVSSSEVVGSGTNTITITPNTPLQPSTLYTIRINNTNIIDASGNQFDGGTWRFNTNSSPVQLINKAPSNDATGIDVASNLVLTFDQQVQASSTKKVQIRKVSNNQLVFDQYANHSRISISGSQVTIDPSTNFDRNTQYYVTIEAGAFYSASNANDIYYGISSATEWRFQTGFGSDGTAPLISKYSPERSSTKVGTTERIILTFTEPVFVKNGSIEIREYNSGALYRTIDATSNRISGAGTDTITIDPHSSKTGEAAKSFTVGTRYYVTISNQAFADAANNTFAGISSKNYSFTVSNNQVGPQLQSLSPVNLSTTVPTNASFKLTFDKAVEVDDLNNRAMIYSLSNHASNVTALLSIDSKNNKVVVVTPVVSLQSNTDYYINIDGQSILDTNGNYFVGIQNQYQWKFKTLGGDVTPPTIVKTEVSGSAVRIVFNEMLNEDLKPSPASFYVTVAGNPRNISSVNIQGNVVFLTLSSAVTSNQQVLVSYSKGTIGQVQDLTGNQAADFSNVIATNGFTETNPVITSSSYNGSTITLTFSEALDTVNPLAYTQFTVSVNGKAVPINRLAQTTTNLVLTMNESIASRATVIVSYSQGLYPIQGLSNNKVNSFSHTVGTTTGNVTGAIALQTITSSANKIYLKYNKVINSTSKPGTYQYSVLVNGRGVSVSSIDITTDTVVLTLGSTPAVGDIIYVTYYGTGSTLLDSNYEAAASFTNQKVSNGTNTDTSGTTVSVQGAVAKGDTLTINFSGNLDTGSVPNANSFLVRVSENTRVISHVSVSGSQVILKLNAKTKVGEVVKVSYFKIEDTLRSASGIAVAGFTDMNVANQTTILDNLSSDFASDPTGIIIKSSASSISSDTSPGGYNTNRYTLDTDKVVTAISTMADGQLTKANIIFEVPSSERAAIVSVSVSALEYAARKGQYTIVVKHGDKSYELPISAINLTDAARALGGNSVSNYVKFIIEEGETPATTSLVTAINRSGATLLEGPFYYDTLVINGTQSQKAKITAQLTRKVESNRSITNSTTTAVFYDEVVGQLSYVPTTFGKSGSITTITFKRPGNSAYAIVSNQKLYADSTNHWGLSSISLMTRKFIADGHSNTNFNPKTNITRGEFATYLVRGLGLSANKEAAKKFTDVNSNSVMGGYIGAAVEAGLVSGTSATKFNPNSNITRQDMAIMLIRVAGYVGMDTKLSSTADSVLGGYKDKSSVSTYARTGLAQAIEYGLISGTSATTLSPKDNAERVQGIIMLQRLLEKAGYLQK